MANDLLIKYCIQCHERCGCKVGNLHNKFCVDCHKVEICSIKDKLNHFSDSMVTGTICPKCFNERRKKNVCESD